MISATSWPRAMPRAGLWTLVGLLIALGVVLRLRYLDEGSLFIDEGESCINALTILEHGYPADTYLGQPIFENTLTDPWPEHPEYEFRDTSYSSKGMAIYHGWLPLYAIAASFRLHGIGPDRAEPELRVRHDDESIRARIHAARLPSVVFGAVFLLAIYLLGARLYGETAGLAALMIAALLPKCIWLAQQARYYSAGLALSTIGLWTLVRLTDRPRLRDHALAGVALVLLFHTSSLAFAILCLSSLVLAPSVLRQPGWRAGVLLVGTILLAGILPWMLWTGYFQHTGRIPMARSLLELGDYFLFVRTRPARGVAGALLVLAFAVAWLRRERLPARLGQTMTAAGGPVTLLVTWTLVSYFGFQLLVPAASCSLARLSHNLLVAPILLGALGTTLLARALVPALATPIALGANLALLIGSGNFLQWQRRNPYEAEAVSQTIAALRAHPFRTDTRIYALPYQHFCLTFYTGLPVQSIAPVRRSFLDSYEGEILLLEITNRLPAPQWSSVLREAHARGVELGESEARTWVPKMMALMIRSETRPLVRSFAPDPANLPAWAVQAAEALRHEAATSLHGHFDYALDNPAMFQGYPPLAIDDFWPVFFYRFVEPGRRVGSGLNYAGRLAEAEARLLPCSWLVLRVPARAEGAR
jgi:hypothetical protein